MCEGKKERAKTYLPEMTNRRLDKSVKRILSDKPHMAQMR